MIADFDFLRKRYCPMTSCTCIDNIIDDPECDICKEYKIRIHSYLLQCSVQRGIDPRVAYQNNVNFNSSYPQMNIHKSINDSVLPVNQNILTRGRGRISNAGTEVLKRWTDDNRNNNYPSKRVQMNLSRESKLSPSQVNNWFVHYRSKLRKSLEKNRNTISSFDSTEYASQTVSIKNKTCWEKTSHNSSCQVVPINDHENIRSMTN